LSLVSCGGGTGLDGPVVIVNTGGTTSVGKTDSGAIDSGSVDAGGCTYERLALSVCGNTECCPIIGCGAITSNARDLVNCRLKLRESPSLPDNTAVIINCAPFSHYGGYENGQVPDAGDLDGWTFDYSTVPATLVFGAIACEQLQQLGPVDVTVTQGCNFIC
jgi:hypothetical protein